MAHNPNQSAVAYYCGRRNMFMGRWIRHAMPPGMIMRLFRPSHVRFERLVNPVPVIDGPHGYLRGMLDHYNFSKGISEWIEKHNRYSQLEALEGDEVDSSALGSAAGTLQRRSRSAPSGPQESLHFRLPWRPFLKFLYLYVWQRGWLDGRAGFTYCVLQSYYEYMIVRENAGNSRRREQGYRPERERGDCVCRLCKHG